MPTDSPAFSPDTCGDSDNFQTALNLVTENFFKPDARLYRHDSVYIRSFVEGKNAAPCNAVKQEKLQESLPNHAIHLLTYLLTPWSRALLEKLTGFQLVKKFPAFYGT